MSAVHLVAYGVFKISADVDFHTTHDKEIRQLVKNQLKHHDILLSDPPSLKRYRVSLPRRWSVYGPLTKVGAYKIREHIGTGNYKECCVAIARWLDRHNKLEK